MPTTKEQRKPCEVCSTCHMMPRAALHVGLLMKRLMEQEYNGSLTIDFHQGVPQINRLRKLETVDAATE